MLDFMIFNGFTYSSIPKDKNLSSPYATGGRGQRDSTWGTVEIGYGILDNLWIDLGILTVQMPKSADNESFRFPFFDFSSAANNQTTIYFDIVGTF